MSSDHDLVFKYGSLKSFFSDREKETIFETETKTKNGTNERKYVSRFRRRRLKVYFFNERLNCLRVTTVFNFSDHFGLLAIRLEHNHVG